MYIGVLRCDAALIESGFGIGSSLVLYAGTMMTVTKLHLSVFKANIWTCAIASLICGWIVNRCVVGPLFKYLDSDMMLGEWIIEALSQAFGARTAVWVRSIIVVNIIDWVFAVIFGMCIGRLVPKYATTSALSCWIGGYVIPLLLLLRHNGVMINDSRSMIILVVPCMVSMLLLMAISQLCCPFSNDGTDRGFMVHISHDDIDDNS